MRTVWLEFTRQCWGPGIDRTLFGPVFRVGWFGFGVSRLSLTEWINTWRAPLERAMSGDQKPSGKGQQK